MSRVLVAEDSPTQAQQLQFLLGDAGFQVDTVGNGREALAALARKLPDLIVTDLEMPEMNGLELVEYVRSKYPAIPVVLMTAFGSEEIATLALQKGAASYVPKRYLTQEIVNTLNNLLSVAQAAGQRRRIVDLLTHTDYRFVLDNDDTLVAPLIAFLEDMLALMRLCDQTGLIRVCVALREALIDAMHHGNLEIGPELREKQDKAFRAEVDRRRAQEPYRNRRVYFRVEISRLKAQFVIRNEGPACDPLALPKVTDLANLEMLSSRGLMLIRTFMDQVEYSEKGNEVTLVKRCDFQS